MTLDQTTTLKVALFVPASTSKTERTYRKVGSTVTATWTRSAAAELPPIVLEPREQPLTAAEVLPLVEHGDVATGQRLFAAASCVMCHRVGREGKTFGPDLTSMGDKADAMHLIESMLAPSATIAEGFALISVSTSDGKSYSGVFKEETNRSLVLVQMDSTPVSIDKTLISSRESLHASVMPPFGNTFSPQQMADVVAFLLAQRSQALESTLPSDGPRQP